jgi:hypothetical protein
MDCGDSTNSPACHDITVELSSLDAVLASTLALMTGYAQHQCEHGNVQCRHSMAHKIATNLASLTTHPSLSQPMATVMRHLQGHWRTLLALDQLETRCSQSPDARAASTVSALWLPPHSSMQ